ncbi:DUF192 domain-containing protein [Halocynthiibacter sp. C4]|nr:DUF192 domain-containing protein [Halocynthiibacter sp. C4]MDE0589781.1 DUF192 domain-containing protein [Halocynthiibacter sp. C4]
MKRAAAAACVAIAASTMTSGAIAECASDRVSLRGPWGQAQFTVEIADTERSRATGLMNRESMPRGAGMLFLYDSPRAMTFWMRNTLIPLDILFISPQGEVLHIHQMAKPLDETLIPGPDGAIAVLEINGGLAETFGMTAGTEVQHNFFEKFGAKWPCEAS